jgi:predicted transcriptional regulator
MGRSRWEIILDLLKTTLKEKKAKKTRIMQKTNLNWRNFNKHFPFLLEEGFIEECTDEKCYELTKRGRELLERLENVNELLKTEAPKILIPWVLFLNFLFHFQ